MFINDNSFKFYKQNICFEITKIHKSVWNSNRNEMNQTKLETDSMISRANKSK